MIRAWSFFSFASSTASFAPSTMFFAMCGAFSKNGQWTPKALTFFGFITAAVVIGVTIPGYINIYFGVIELVLAALVILASYSPATQRFVAQAD